MLCYNYAVELQMNPTHVTKFVLAHRQHISRIRFAVGNGRHQGHEIIWGQPNINTLLLRKTLQFK